MSRRPNPEPTVEVYRDRQGEVSSVKVRLAGGEVSAVRPDPAEREMYVGWSGLPETERGKGLGIRMYAALMDWALENDFILTSDESVSREAGRVWEALARRGYPIRKHPEARTITEGDIGVWYAHGRKPPFLLHRRNPRRSRTAPLWFTRGTLVPSDFDALEAASSDAPYILEPEDLAMEWRTADVPLSAVVDSGRVPDPTHLAERLSAIRGASSLSRPIYQLRPDGKVEILDGWHRLQVAKARGERSVSALVGAPRSNPRRGYTSAMRTDPELWEEVKAEVTRGSKGGLPDQWSARKAQLAVALYKARGGDYYGPKSPYNALAKWTREKWRTKSGRPSLETGERYLPSAAIAALTPAEYAATTRAKRAGMKKGQQFVPQPEAVAKKVRRYRRNPEDRGHILDLMDRLEEFKSSVMEAAGDDPSETTFDPMEYPIDSDTLRSYLDVPVLGWGASRVAVRLPSGNVAKLPWTSESDENEREWDRWQEASLEVQQMLLPPLEYVSGVLVFPHVRTVNDRDYDDPELAAARARWSALYMAGEPGSDVEDFRNTQNWGIHDGRLVLIDYAE